MKESGTSSEKRVTELDRRGFLQAVVGAGVASTLGLGSTGTATASGGDSPSETIPSGEATSRTDDEGGSNDHSGGDSVTDTEDDGLGTTGKLLAVGGGGVTALLGYALVRSLGRPSSDDLHRVHVRVIEKGTGNPLDEPATLNCSFHDGDHTKTRELPSGTALLQLHEGMWTFRVEYSGGIHEEEVDVSAATQTLDIAIEPDEAPESREQTKAPSEAVKKVYVEALDRYLDNGPVHAKEQTKATLEEQLSTLNEELRAARRARRIQQYDRALDSLDQALDAGTVARDAAREVAPGRTDQITSVLAEAKQLRTEIESERDAFRQVTTEIERVEDRLSRAEDAVEAGDDEKVLDALAADDYEEAVDALAVIETVLDDLRATVEEYDFESTRPLERNRRRVDGLREHVESILEAARTSRVPVEIPAPPRLSLDYDDIEKGELVGSGGNADVYSATTTTRHDEVALALKEPRVSETLHTETVERMMEEAETWQRLDDHDHIVSVIDYGSQPMPWIAMEYMDAGHLGDRADEMSFEQRVWSATQITEGVRHAHRRGVAHLDLKPENILFRHIENAWDVPKVADWGLSKHLLQHSKSVEGISPHYAAPEQFDDAFGVTDDITDIYQLGTVFYELFTGRPPFEGGPMKVMRAVIDDEPAPPSEHADVPEKLDEILLTALAKDKSARYESVLYLRDELQEL